MIRRSTIAILVPGSTAVHTTVALLRAINLGSTNKVSMPKLKAAIEGLGFEDVRTYINSGNVVITSAKKPTTAALEQAIASELGVKTTVVLRTAAELKKALAANPFTDADPSKVQIIFLPARASVAGLDADPAPPDEYRVKGKEIYCHYPNGQGRSKLAAYLGRTISATGTSRGLKTVTKLLELASG
jgi:uncharacterized protein (DUF1697 family)